MKIYKMFVDDRDYNNNDGYTLYIDSEYTLGTAVETAVKNGFNDIKISLADKREVTEMNLIKGANLYIGEELK